MTTPADWKTVVAGLKDPESIRFAHRVVTFNVEWLQTQLGHLEELQSALDTQLKSLTAKRGK